MTGLDSVSVWRLARALTLLERTQQGEPAIPSQRSSSRFDRIPVTTLLTIVIQVCDAGSVHTPNVDMARTLKSELEMPRAGALPNPVDPREVENIRRVANGLRAELEIILEQRKFAELVEPDGLVNYRKLRDQGLVALVDGRDVDAFPAILCRLQFSRA
jgi:hypothetical protein